MEMSKEDKELNAMWIKDIQEFLDQARKNNDSSEDSSEEFIKQQEIYTKYAETYDKAVGLENYTGPVKITEKLNALFPNRKDIRILDYGCGTGLAADSMSLAGFQNVDGLDSNKGLLKAARKKRVMKNYFQLRSDQNHDVLPSASYDVICSTGVFFVSKSHPGFECLRELLKLLKKGGFLLIVTKNTYLDYDYVDHNIVEILEKEKIMKVFPKELSAGYRKTLKFEEDQKSMAATLLYQKL